MQTNNILRTVSIIIFMIIFSSILIINTKTPMIGEDYALSLQYYDKINSSTYQKLTLIYERMQYQFTNWNSRFGEQLAILFLGFDKTFFNILNSFAFIVLAAINVRFGIGETNSISTTKLLIYTSLVLMMYYIFLPALGESVFWLTGSTNYLWGLVFLLFFLLPFINILERPTKAEQRLPFYYLILGFFAGMTNENTVPVSIIFCCLAIVRLRLNKSKVNFAYYLAFIFHCIGYASLLFSPSTKIRREYYDQIFGSVNPSLSVYLDRLVKILADFFYYYKSYIFVTLILLTLYFIVRLISKNNLGPFLRSRPFSLILFILFSFIAVIDMIAVPYYEVRSSLLTFFALTSFIISIIDYFSNSKRPLFFLSVFLLLLGWLFTFNNMRITYNRFDADFQKRETILLGEVGLKKTIVVPRFSEIQDQRLLNSREFYLEFNNLNYSAYYGYDEIQIK